MESLFSLFVIFSCIKYVSCLSLGLDSLFCNCELIPCLFGGKYCFTDLGYPNDPNSLRAPKNAPFNYTGKSVEVLDDGTTYETKNMSLGEKIGTHLVAPLSYNQYGPSTAGIILEHLITPVVFADVRSKVGDNSDYVITTKDIRDCIISIKPYIKDYKSIAFVLVSGWYKNYNGNRDKYTGEQADGTMHFPSVSVEAIHFILRQLPNLVCIGSDTLMLSSKNHTVHAIVAEHNIHTVANLRIDEGLPLHCKLECVLGIFPMKNRLGTGSPARVIAICPCPKPT